MATQVTGELYFDIDGQLAEIKRQLRQPNGYPFDTGQLKRALQAAIEGRFGPEATPAVYRVSIDYGRSLTAMIKAGGYDWVNPGITEKRFPVKGTGIVECEFVLCHYDRVIKSDEAVRLMVQADYGPATIEDLLAFGEKYPEEQRKYPIVALGSTAEVLGYRDVPSLHRDAAKRALYLYWSDSRWGERCRFLARKRSAT